MTDIRVNPDMLEWGASEFAPLVRELNSIGTVLHLASWYGDIGSQYAGQLAGMFRSEGANALTGARHCSHELSELSLWLRELAKRFEEVDQAAFEGMERLLLLNQAFIDEYGDSPLVPQYLIDGTRPPWIPIDEWMEMSLTTQRLNSEFARIYWARFLANRTPGSFRPAAYDAAYLEEMFMIYMFGLPASHFDPETGEQVSAYRPEHELFEKPDLPDGSEEYDFPHWQDQDLEALISNPRTQEFLIDLDINKTQAWHRRHINLCGLDAAGHAVGAEHMIQAYAAFSHIREGMLINNDTAWVHEIKALYEELGWEAKQAGRFASSEVHWDDVNRLAYPDFDDVQSYLEQGYVITALTNVDSSADGFLTADPNIESGHFPNIIETMTTRDGTQLVRVYNSMEHREEIYTWEQFSNSWEDAGPNSGGQAVLARPPDFVP